MNTTTSPRLSGQSLHRRTEADAKAPAFWVATLDTRNFFFEAYGLTEASCMDAMRRTLEQHALTHRCAPDFVTDFMADVQAQQRAMGEGYRDHQCLTGGK